MSLPLKSMNVVVGNCPVNILFLQHYHLNTYYAVCLLKLYYRHFKALAHFLKSNLACYLYGAFWICIAFPPIPLSLLYQRFINE